MECDSDHAQIEKKKVYDAPIYHPHDWEQLIRLTCKKSPFEVVELKTENIYDFASILKTSVTGIQMKKKIKVDTK
ncbi:Uncharacterized protein FWK35_00023721 [Aphis craccivora]|uniref:Uncharacterized protein n=1 Tax=Aphis craccivora TaxID=307492 RepID=A0A6G0VUG4_APHCR|nr:Uncharacterized protein FWK35_00023721 [Aphis craccivora]